MSDLPSEPRPDLHTAARSGRDGPGPTLSVKLAATLQDTIVTGVLRPGDRLPSERNLMQDFGVSRSVVREAIHLLEAKGLVIGAGRRGHHVAATGPETVAESMQHFLRGTGEVDYSSLSEVRAVLEVELARLAAKRATPDDIEALKLACERQQAATSSEESALADVEFHQAIARSTRNQLFVVMLDSIRKALLEAQLPALADAETRAYVNGAHQRIYERIAARDAPGARRAMSDHLSESQRRLEQAHSESKRRAIVDGGPPAGSSGSRP